MSRSVLEFLKHIQEEIAYLQSEIVPLEKTGFLTSGTHRRAAARSLEIIGEAVKHLPEELRSDYPQIQWRAVAGLRDRLIHGYFGVDYEIVWDVVVNHLPALSAVVDTILSREDSA